MNNRDRKNNNNSGFIGLAVIAVFMILRGVVDAIMGSNILGLIIPIATIAVFGAVLGILFGKKKSRTNKGTVYQKERAMEKAKNYFSRDDVSEQAIKCTHPRGREKYIYQLDNFLSNGIIDKSEYRVLKERYDKLKIPDNMH